MEKLNPQFNGKTKSPKTTFTPFTRRTQKPENLMTSY
jgi:hypothetical protein